MQTELDAEKAALADLSNEALPAQIFENQLGQASQRLALQTQNLATQTRRADEASSEVERLTMAVESLRSELSRLRGLLAEREKQAEEDKIAITNLGKALNSALANKVQELRRFRSEFSAACAMCWKGEAMLRWSGTALSSSLKYCLSRDRQALVQAARTIGTNRRRLTEIIDQIPEDIPGYYRLTGIQMMYR